MKFTLKQMLTSPFALLSLTAISIVALSIVVLRVAPSQANIKSVAPNRAATLKTDQPIPICQEMEDNTESESETASEENIPTESAAISPAQAEQIAQRVVNGPIRETELERENNQLLYSVKIGQTDIEIDANTGVVLCMETGDD